MMAQTKSICLRHFGKIIDHDNVAAIPEGIRLRLTVVNEGKGKKKKAEDDVLHVELFDAKDRSWDCGDFGGTVNMLDLSKVPAKLRTATYIAIAFAADKADLS